ncbi:MAG: MFS transporter [Betaproteobacteria bacterium]|nr:MAG: MFS transporter [Betaproteobacteria bacterium]TMG77906.1 MAG: MFS transporter [Betaproteobacteria bacterium]
MSSLELRGSLSLASLFALRMLGLFLILPVFAVHARHLTGGDSQTLVGVALGIYGLTQGILQIPYGMASDRYGRKRVIVIGLLLFALGSFVAAWTSDIHAVILGRAIQGTGAIAAPVTAFIADITREEHRTKAMAMVGGSIGLTFAVSLVAAPALYRSIGMDGIFELTGALSLAAIWMTLAVVPAEPRSAGDSTRRVQRGALGEVLRNTEQLRLNLGIFSLHVVQMAIFVVIPVALVRYGGLAVSEHWKIYLPVVLGSFALMMPPLVQAERRGRMKFLFLAAIVLLLAVELGFAVCYTNFAMAIALLLAFFVAFNILEASLPSLVSRVAPPASRGTALGVYNTTQALGLFVGGAAGGWLAKNFGDPAVFVFGFAVIALWLGVASGMRVPGETVERAYRVSPRLDPTGLRERLVRSRGVREAVIVPEQGIARLKVYPESFDERAVREIIEGES